MKIKTTVTEIECTAEEIRQSNTLADSICNVFRQVFNGSVYSEEEEEKDE
jgi:hypothetical protein